MALFCPEGVLYETHQNKINISNIENLNNAYKNKTVLEARVIMCDNAHNLIVDLGEITGIIPKNQGAVGIEDGSTKDIALISKVGKPVCFVIENISTSETGKTIATLSRKSVQIECMETYIKKLAPGDIIDARVTHLEHFGAFVDIGCGIASLIPIDAISVSRISHPSDRFLVGQDIKAVVKSTDDCTKICLSHKELLGTWDENIKNFTIGETTCGIIRSVEDYGVFVELAPNLAGLAEPKPEARVGQHVSVYIKAIIPEKMKIKLVIVDIFDCEEPPTLPVYQITDGHISTWQYSSEQSDKLIISDFT